MRTQRNFLVSLMLLILAGIGVSACHGPNTAQEYPQSPEDIRDAKRGKLTGEEGIIVVGHGHHKADKGGSGVGVNSFLWRASLDTISFMPLAQVDPHGGVIITDWYENPDSRGERFKLTVLILGTELRADGVRVSVFRQKQAGGGWQDASADAKVGRDLEDKILTRARELKVASRTDD